MKYEGLIVEQVDAALAIRLNGPEKRNAFTFLMMDELSSALAAADRDPGVLSVILTGGNECFSAGVDLNSMHEIGASSDFMNYLECWRMFNEALENHNKPMIAAIEGFCLTGGFELALAFDIRIGAHGSQYGITSSKIGTVSGAGATQRLSRIAGSANALEILFSSDFVDAEQAKEMDLLNRLVEKGSSLAAAIVFAEKLATWAPLSHRYIKRAVYSGMQMPLADAIKF